MSSINNILDTLRLDPTGFYLKNFHVQRTFETYAALDVETSLKKISTIYDTIEKDLLDQSSEVQRVRILFNPADFSYSTVAGGIGEPIPVPVRLELMKNANQPEGLGLMNYKWQDRTFWDHLLSERDPSADDIVSVNTKNYVTETSRFNIFTYSEKDDVVYTPSLDSGCINGVYRRFVLQSRKIELPHLGFKSVFESSINVTDLKKSKIFVANSVRGVLACSLV